MKKTWQKILERWELCLAVPAVLVLLLLLGREEFRYQRQRDVMVQQWKKWRNEASASSLDQLKNKIIMKRAKVEDQRGALGGVAPMPLGKMDAMTYQTRLEALIGKVHEVEPRLLPPFLEKWKEGEMRAIRLVLAEEWLPILLGEEAWEFEDFDGSGTSQAMCSISARCSFGGLLRFFVALDVHPQWRMTNFEIRQEVSAFGRPLSVKLQLERMAAGAPPGHPAVSGHVPSRNTRHEMEMRQHALLPRATHDPFRSAIPASSFQLPASYST